MKLYPSGVMEGSPEELAEYKKLMQAKPEPKAPPSTMNPWLTPRVGVGMITGRADQFPPLWNSLHPAANEAPLRVWVNGPRQVDGRWTIFTS
jgi:hypothetical protein